MDFIVGRILRQIGIGFSWYRYAWAIGKRILHSRNAEMHDQSCCHKFFHPLRKEFRKENFSLKHQPIEDFFKSQWQKNSKSPLWLIYRWCLAVCFSVGVLGSLIQHFSAGKWFIYLTDWGFFMCMFTSVFSAVLTSIYHCNPNKFNSDSAVLKFYWATYTSNLLLATLITFVYWLFIFPVDSSEPSDLYNLWAHGFNSILMLLDLMLVAFPIRILHFVYPFGVGLIYGIFSLIYYFAGGVDPNGNPYIYEILDWSDPGWAVLTVFGCVLIVFVFCFVIFALYKLRCWIYRKTNNSVAIITVKA